MSVGLAQIQHFNGQKVHCGFGGPSEHGLTCQLPIEGKKGDCSCSLPEDDSELLGLSPLQAIGVSSSRHNVDGFSQFSSANFQGLSLRGLGWGPRRCAIGLKGGGEMANGASGWGTPPGSLAVASGWGAPPLANLSTNPGWGNSIPPTNQPSEESPQNHDDSPVKNNPVMAQASPTSQSQLTSTSWAAAACKGLPPSEPPSKNVASVPNEPSARQLEQLNSVREALFSQDGWGSNQVKQKSAWKVDGMEQNLQSASEENSSPTWENVDKPRNDGTDLWKSTLSGQPMVTKSSSASEWHKPQNPTDYKNWGEEDDNQEAFGAVGGASSGNVHGSVGSHREGSIWNSYQPVQNSSSQAKQPSSNWSNEPSKEQNFSDPQTSPVEAQNWDQPTAQRHQNSWGNADHHGPSRNTNERVESPPMGRHNSANDNSSIWGNKQTSNPPVSGLNWKDSPPRNPNFRAAPYKENTGWIDQPDPNNLWGIEKPDSNRWGDSQWAVGQRGRAPPMSRNPTDWEDHPQDSGWRAEVPKKSYYPDNPRSSKQFKVLMTMGFSPDDAEYALRSTNGILEDAYEMLNAKRMREQNSSVYQGHQESGNIQGMHLPPGNMGAQDAYDYKVGQMPMRSQEQKPGVASSNQLKVLVTKIQMAVQTGHLNPRILHQRLAPQTLVCLNKLLIEVKTLQMLQQQVSSNGGADVMSINLNIGKVKQNITSLQNQINHHQNSFLQKNQTPQMMPQMSDHSFEQSMQETYDYGQGQTSHTQESQMIPGGPNKSRLNLWKSHQESGETRVQSGANMKTGLGFDDSTWSSSSNNSGSKWPYSAKPSAANLGNLGVGGNPFSSALDGFGIPEFEPGKLWKGVGMKNPNDDPSLTPGSLAQMDINSLTRATSAVSIRSQNENLEGSDCSNNFGLTKPWSNNVPKESNDDLMANSNQNWVVFRNLSQQIDRHTLKTWCVQQGPVKQFHVFPAQSIALTQYTSDGIAFKAQKYLRSSFIGSNVQIQLLKDQEAMNMLQVLRGIPGNGYMGMNTKTSPANDVWEPSCNLFSAPSSIWSTPGQKPSEAQQDDFLSDM